MKTEKNQNKETVLKYTSEGQVKLKKPEPSFEMYEKDATKLKKLVENFSEGFRVWEQVVSISIASFLTLLISACLTPKGTPGKSTLFDMMIFTGTIGVMAFIFMLSKKSDNSNTKKNILAEMDEIFCFSAEEFKQDNFIETEKEQPSKKVLNDWSTSKSSLPQGANFLPIELNRQLISSLSFSVNSASEYWRAGFKLATPNVDATSALLTQGSFLFHVAFGKKELGLSIYRDGNLQTAIHKKLTTSDMESSIIITMERSDRNFLNCFVNDSLEYSTRLKSNYFKKAYLCTWGDMFDFKTDISNIEYS